MGLFEKGLRCVAIPQFVALMLIFIALLTIGDEPMYYLPIVVMSVFVGWLVEQLLYHMMISRGIDACLDTPQKVYYQEDQPIDVLEVIHRCGVPSDW